MSDVKLIGKISSMKLLNSFNLYMSDVKRYSVEKLEIGIDSFNLYMSDVKLTLEKGIKMKNCEVSISI